MQTAFNLNTISKFFYIRVLDDLAYPSHIALTLPLDETWGSSQDEQWSFVFWSNKKRVYGAGEEFHVQVNDDFVELATKEEMGELPEEVDNKEVMPLWGG